MSQPVPKLLPINGSTSLSLFLIVFPSSFSRFRVFIHVLSDFLAPFDIPYTHPSLKNLPFARIMVLALNAATFFAAWLTTKIL